MIKIKRFILKYQKKIELTVIFATTLFTPLVANAAVSSEWTVVYNKLSPWIPRIVMLFMFSGGVEFASGVAEENYNSRLKGTAKMVAGGCLFAVWESAKGVFGL